MKKNLVIVESPAKSKTIGKFLGKNYEIKASFGHVRDLPAYRLGVNIANNFEPHYEKIKGKQKVLKELAEIVKKIDKVYLATDPDREGEAIAWHIKEALKIPQDKFERITFNEITKDAVQNAIKNARDINLNLVDAQQARRVLDRLIGYKLSPLLAKKIKRGLSAGRVQSVTVRLVYDREIEIENFVQEEYWVIESELEANQKKLFKARLFAKDSPSKKIVVNNKDTADEIVEKLKKSNYQVEDIKKSKLKKSPAFPFITSTLQQEAAKKYNWSATKTMFIAQQLYEGLEINGEPTGLITYMRTDSVRISDDAKNEAQKYIVDQFGQEYLASKSRISKKVKNVQDAHEAIRPTYLTLTPKNLEGKLSLDHFKLYKLIWDRFLASQMSEAIFDNTQVIVRASTPEKESFYLKAIGNVLVFPGFRKIYIEEKEETTEENADQSKEIPNLPLLTKDELLKLIKVLSEQKFTQPPSRYTEASLVKELEEKGIGRPSTYAPTLHVIQDREYVKKEKKYLHLTDLGRLVTEELLKFFSNVLDVNFTAGMEKELDEIMEGRHIWQEIISRFYFPFEKLLEIAIEKMEKINLDKPTDQICEKCGSPMVIKSGRFGEFLACTNYPTCKNAKSLKPGLGVKCPECDGEIKE
ncbi:MAG: type I DNA topoisomerase, partial [Candidatus Margulisiibacteriota bacterium]